MLISVLKSKIHGVTVTEHNLEYEGSLTLDRDLIDGAGLHVYEKIAVWNKSNGHRFETYVIEGAAGSGVVCVNGAAAHLARKGDQLIVAAYALVEAPAGRGHAFEPRVVRVDAGNHPLPDRGPERAR